jgi:hypothetical protein
VRIAWASLKAMTTIAALGNALGGDVLRHGFADRGSSGPYDR